MIHVLGTLNKRPNFCMLCMKVILHINVIWSFLDFRTHSVGLFFVGKNRSILYLMLPEQESSDK